MNEDRMNLHSFLHVNQKVINHFWLASPAMRGVSLHPIIK